MGGIPLSVPALTVNKLCLSGLNAIAPADQLIGYGEFDVVWAGGWLPWIHGFDDQRAPPAARRPGRPTAARTCDRCTDLRPAGAGQGELLERWCS